MRSIEIFKMIEDKSFKNLMRSNRQENARFESYKLMGL